jgi:hypothetical protein
MARLPTGSILPEATLEAGARLASAHNRRPRPAHESLGPGLSERASPVADQAVSGDASADVDWAIDFIPERSSGDRWTSESIVAHM